MPALDSLEGIQRGALFCLFIRGCRTFTGSLEDCSNAKIVGSPKVSDCLFLLLWRWKTFSFTQKCLPTGNAQVTQLVAKIYVRFSTEFQRVTKGS